MIDSMIFGHLKQSDHHRIARLVEEGKTQEVLDAFRQWLTVWKSGNWIDEEKIHFTVVDLRNLKVWSVTPLQSFIDTLNEIVCPEVIAILMKA